MPVLPLVCLVFLGFFVAMLGFFVFLGARFFVGPALLPYLALLLDALLRLACDSLGGLALQPYSFGVGRAVNVMLSGRRRSLIRYGSTGGRRHWSIGWRAAHRELRTSRTGQRPGSRSVRAQGR